MPSLENSLDNVEAEADNKNDRNENLGPIDNDETDMLKNVVTNIEENVAKTET